MKTMLLRPAGLSAALLLGCVLGALGCSAAPEAPTEAPTEASSEEALTGSFPVGTRFHTTNGANLRTAPSLQGAILTVIPAGTTVLCASAQPKSGWYGVTYLGKTGWLKAELLANGPASGAQSGGFTRSQVYQIARSHMRPGAERVAEDFLDPNLTTQALVNAVGWLATHSPPSWEISAINSNHHYDPAAHSGGYALDLYNTQASEDARFVQLVDQDPFVVEVGLSGDYTVQRNRLSGMYVFIENAPTHVHLAVKQAYGSFQ